MTPTHTDNQLKQALAKMLPERLIISDGILSWLFEQKAQRAGDTHWAVLDTELLHLCWLVEESLGELTDYGCELAKSANAYHSYDHEVHWGKLAHATWQQRVIALAKVKGVEIV